MRRGDDVRMGFVDRRMDRECGLVQRPRADRGFAAGIHEQQVGHLDLREMHAERVHPEVIGQLRIARGDVAGEARRETEAREQAERGREPLLPVAAFGGDVGARRGRVEPEMLARRFGEFEARCGTHGRGQDGGHDEVSLRWAQAARRAASRAATAPRTRGISSRP